ncbi:hypothetical protein TNCV_4787861 [Trichonephila clavipes]|nr:hypothetical protein TNCV_4787861 [Trichonephila clavipes]
MLWTCYQASPLPEPNCHVFLLLGPPKITWDTGGYSGERTTVASADIASTSDLFERVQQSFVHQCWLFMTYATATSKNS